MAALAAVVEAARSAFSPRPVTPSCSTTGFSPATVARAPTAGTAPAVSKVELERPAAPIVTIAVRAVVEVTVQPAALADLEAAAAADQAYA